MDELNRWLDAPADWRSYLVAAFTVWWAVVLAIAVA